MTTPFRVADRRRPVVDVTVSKYPSPGNNTPTIMRTVIVDTGFTNDLCLLWSDIAALQLDLAGLEELTLADGIKKSFRAFRGYASAQGIERPVVILALPSERLLGMGFLKGLDLCISGWPNGTVDIREPT